MTSCHRPLTHPPFRCHRSLLVAVGLVLAVAGFAAEPASPDAGGAARSRVAPGMARIHGHVANAATGVYLQGARVVVGSAGHPVLTDIDGSFTVSVPAGDTSITVSYTGLEPQTVPLSLARGQTVTQDFALTAAIYRMEALVIEGEREGSAMAITRQRAAQNVKNVVAADAYGTMTEDNVGSFLQKLPGLSAEFSTGSVREVMVRGIDASLNTVEMDGVQLANTNSSGTNRFFDFLQASISMVESIEVTKAPTPDMPASSIGGSINMVTRSTFSRANPRSFSYAFGFVHLPDRIGGRAESQKRWFEEPIHGFTPSLRLSYSDVIGRQRNLGVSFNYSRNTQFGGSKDALFNYQARLDRPVYIRNASVRMVQPGGPNTRQNTNLKLEYKLSEHTVFTLAAAYNHYIEINDTRTHLWQTSDTAARFRPGYDEFLSEALPNAATISQLSETANDNVSNNYRLQASALHKFDTLHIDYSATLSKSNGYQNYAPFERKTAGKPKATLTIRGLTNIGWIVDRRRDPAWPIIAQTAGPDAYDLSNYTTMTMTQNHNGAYSTIGEGRLNVRKKVDVTVPAFVKTGIQFHQQQRKKDYFQHSYRFTGPGSLAQFADTASWGHETIHGQRQGPWVDILRVAQHKEDNPQFWPEDLSYKYVQRLRNLQDVREAIASAYVMGSVQLSDLSILAGLRVEDTRTHGNGPEYKLTQAERARRAAWVGPLTEEESRRRALAEWGDRTESKGQYRNVFPGLHFKYAHRSGFVGRASYSTSIGRPGISAIMPNTTINEEAQTATISNTGLRPQKSDNFDVNVEYYFEPVGLFSASAFLKEVTGFIYTDRSQLVRGGGDNGFDGMYEGFTIITSANGGSARYRGFELSYQQQFTFLPGIWKGLGVNLNYTQLETKGDYGGRVATTQVAGFRPKTANIAVNYRFRRFNASFQANWVDTYLISTSTNAALLTYQAPRWLTSAKFTYALTNRTTLYLNWDNILREPLYSQYRAYPERNSTTRYVYPTIAAGVQGRF